MCIYVCINKLHAYIGQILSYSNLHASHPPRVPRSFSVTQLALPRVCPQGDFLLATCSWFCPPRGSYLRPPSSTSSPAFLSPAHSQALIVQSEIIGEHSLQHIGQYDVHVLTAT